ncbi:MAG: SMC family ATPase [Bifidobacteriaceae bacterium]|jgi:exonuclease SbcC|nr:SMC family ATPase [Bifidobacteriaceae bacterium]
MRLHRLEFGEIGPFTGTRVIDFTDLTASGLFLLEGPTGAGKSTLIDALVFALYGSLGESGSYDRLRSDFAPDNQESFVDLTYEVSSGIFRIRRTPRYERARQRSRPRGQEDPGGGDSPADKQTTTKNATARLWRLSSPSDQRGDLIATRVEEASTEVLETIGLSREQFVQTVVLPQGRFASFLKADNEERRVLLQRIFGTKIYQDLADELKNRRLEAESAQLGLSSELTAAVNALAKTASLPAEQIVELTASAAQAAEAGNRAALAELCDQVSQRAQAEGRRAADAQKEATERAQRAKATALKAAAQAQTAATKRSLTGRLEELSADSPRRAQETVRLQEARRAGPVIASLDAVLDAKEELETAAAAGTKAGLTQQQLDQAKLQEVGLLDDLQTALERAQADSRQAQDQLKAAQLLEGAVATATAADQALTLAQAKQDRARTAAANAAKLVERESEQGPHVRAEVSRLEQLALITDQYAKAIKALTTIRRRSDQARKNFEDAQRQELALRDARLAGMAGEMATDLQAGRPCPVCGGTEHPAPAQLAVDHVTREQVEAAEQGRSAAEAAYERSAAKTGEAQALTAKLEGSGGDSDPVEVANQLESAKTALAELGDPANLREALERAQAGLESANLRSQEAQAAAAAAHDQLVQARSLSKGSGAAAAKAALTQAKGRVTVTRRRLEAAHLVTQAAAVAHATEATAQRALAEAGFASPEQAHAVRLSADQIQRIEDELNKLAGEAAAIQQRLAEPELAAAKGDPTELNDAATRAKVADDQATEAVTEAARHAAVASQRAAAIAAAAADVLCTAEVLARAKRDTAAVIRVANLANAGKQNLRDVDLPTYVLIKRFEEVIDAANGRLRPMSDGQYQLERSDAKEATRKHRTGLALRVMDNSTGQARDPRTLSGGETFYVSLALALGLADIVTAEAGGISLETLFVDEGFGSLSEEALESVLVQLRRIHAGGRVVGVVSHVEALKQAIPDRIEVRPALKGTSTLTVRSARRGGARVPAP